MVHPLEVSGEGQTGTLTITSESKSRAGGSRHGAHFDAIRKAAEQSFSPDNVALANELGIVFKVKGVAGEIESFEYKLTITPKGLLGVMNKGLKGTKTIPFTSITAIQHKRTGLTSGYI